MRTLALLAILTVAAITRFTGINWDQGTHVHPDERYMTYLASLLELPASADEYFDSGRSRLNPYNVDWGRSYVYGTVPLFAVRAIAGALGIWALWSMTEILTNRLPPEWITRSSYIRMLLVGLILQVVLQKFRAGIIPEKSPPQRFKE